MHLLGIILKVIRMVSPHWGAGGQAQGDLRVWM